MWKTENTHTRPLPIIHWIEESGGSRCLLTLVVQHQSFKITLCSPATKYRDCCIELDTLTTIHTTQRTVILQPCVLRKPLWLNVMVAQWLPHWLSLSRSEPACAFFIGSSLSQNLSLALPPGRPPLLSPHSAFFIKRILAKNALTYLAGFVGIARLGHS